MEPLAARHAAPPAFRCKELPHGRPQVHLPPDRSPRPSWPTAGHVPGRVPARLLAETPAVDPQRLPRLPDPGTAGRPGRPGLRRGRAGPPDRARQGPGQLARAQRPVPGRHLPRPARPRLDPAGAGRGQVGQGRARPDRTLQLPAALAHGRCDDQLRRYRWLGRRPCRPVRRVPAAGPRPPPLADRCQRIDQGQAPAAGLPSRRGAEAAGSVQADPRLGAGAGRHAVPAAERAASRRRRSPLPDLLVRHARTVLGRADQ
ncbi:hypothetical protein D3C72_1266530 [compost metagenome]